MGLGFFVVMSWQCLGLIFDILGGVENLTSKSDHLKNINQFQMLAYMQHKVLNYCFTWDFLFFFFFFISNQNLDKKHVIHINNKFTELSPKYQ